MDNKCPKCNKKLSIFYLKQNCPECGCNMVTYNLEQRLEEDSIKAQAEWDKVDAIIDKVLTKLKIRKRGSDNE